MAGCSAAYFLREIFGDELAIVVFEKAQQVGGRVQRRAFAGTAIETGATLIHSSNAYLSAFIETLGLQRARCLYPLFIRALKQPRARCSGHGDRPRAAAG
jgi:protoporphyrinogen oxidase